MLDALKNRGFTIQRARVALEAALWLTAWGLMIAGTSVADPHVSHSLQNWALLLAAAAAATTVVRIMRSCQGSLIHATGYLIRMHGQQSEAPQIPRQRGLRAVPDDLAEL